MNENKTSKNMDSAIGFCCSSLTPRQMLAARLRDISYHVSDMDKCTLCKAADELDKKPEKFGTDWAFPLLALALSFGYENIDLEKIIECFDASVKKQKDADKKDV